MDTVGMAEPTVTNHAIMKTAKSSFLKINTYCVKSKLTQICNTEYVVVQLPSLCLHSDTVTVYPKY